MTEDTTTPDPGAPDAALEGDRGARRTRFDIGVLGGGSAAETLVRELGGTGSAVVVFEPGRVGGECPYVACIPSKAMLHDAAAGTRWHEAVDRRDDLANHLDDDDHAQRLTEHGATLVRARATITAANTGADETIEVEAAGTTFTVDHLVIATGSEAMIPPIDGLDDLGDRMWTSADAMTATEHPARLTIIGGGAIGCEMAHIFSGFDTEVHLIDAVEHAFGELSAEVGVIVDDALDASGVRVSRGRGVESVRPRGGNVQLELDNGTSLVTDRVLIAAGKRARTAGIGLATLGLDESAPLPIDETGRVECPASVWAIGDVAGKGQYTHVANHQASVVADHLAGSATRRFDEVVVPACIFTDPPVMMVGPSRSELDSDDDVVWASAELSKVARSATDDLDAGFLAVAVRRSTRCVVAAHGVGAKFDELIGSLITAIDGEVPVDRLVRSMRPFPTVGELLTPVYERAIDLLDESTG